MEPSRLIALTKNRRDVLAAYSLARNSLNQDPVLDVVGSLIGNPQMMQLKMVGLITTTLKREVGASEALLYTAWLAAATLMLSFLQSPKSQD